MSINATTIEHAVARIMRAKRVLIVFRQDWDADCYASAIALKEVLESPAIPAETVDIACQGFKSRGELHFLNENAKVAKDLSQVRNLIISLPTDQTEVDELSYEVNNGQLEIRIRPSGGSFSPDDISTSRSEYHYDLVIALGTPNLERLGGNREATEFLFETDIINIDRDPANNYFGQINLIDLSTTSNAEVTYHLIRSLTNGPLSEKIARALLTGMIAATRSFQKNVVTPQALALASELIDRGADREKIITNLYRTRSVNTLKLWGRILANLKEDKDVNLVWATVSLDDLDRTDTDGNQIPDVIDELITSSPQAKIVVLLWEGKDRKIHGVINATQGYDAIQLGRTLEATGSPDQAIFTIQNFDLANAETTAISTIRNAI